MSQCNTSTSWLLLENHASKYSSKQIDEPIPSCLQNFKIRDQNIEIDFSNQKINHRALELLLNLVAESNLREKIIALLSGGLVNESQGLPALHSALRIMDSTPVIVGGRNITPDVLSVRDKMGTISHQIRSGKWLGYSGKPIKSIVNIGMGGSDFGPRFCISALSAFALPSLDYHFVSDVDPVSFESIVNSLDPDTTLFIISSKSFTTYETLYNARKAIHWIGKPEYLEKHFIAITAHSDKALEMGFTNILPIWDWVGGRYSFCSAINLITCIAIGFDLFMQLLAGAHSMDIHFKESEFEHNMPVMLALTGLWNINFLNIPNLLVLVYARQLELFVPYLQQLDMESNGKSFDNQGRSIDYLTGPIVWGGLGNQAQHSYYQLLCQSNHKIAADFISINDYSDESINEFCLRKIRVLSQGAKSTGSVDGYIKGGMPINHITIDSLTPYNLGSLIALYEHKIYVQSVIWNINAFDQPGVESAKRL